LFFILTLIFIYSLIFKAGENAHPVPSAYTLATGLESPGTGLSRAFSELIRGDFDGALNYNQHAYRLFFFFLYLWLSRIGCSALLNSKKGQLTLKSINHLVIADGTVALVLFSWAFYPFIYWIIMIIMVM
jgi:hypothetical protein